MGQLLAALFAIVLGIAGIPLFLQYQQASNDSVIASVTAQQAQTINTAVTSYVQQNSSTLQASATASSPSTITVDMLKSAGFLPSAFSATNPYGQTWTAFVLQPSSGNLQVLVSTTGGTA
ncbi:MAG: shufflon system plasmid conjugative transfer pilus tip adhesin PilV, partial [Methylophilaceae bacterium]|nr:shufflon system plasmid conjugative transfer pilus tip adhesin PilV [Methylophilaceae bacterium]